MISLETLTPTERRMYTVLADGQLHRKRELIECMSDQESSCFWQHVSNLRKKLRPSGTALANTTIDGESFYHITRYLPSPYDGRS